MADHQRNSLLFLALFSCLIYSSYSHQFVVGGRDGWAVKPSKNYNQWSGRMRFQINDTLLFRYKSGSDSVLVVNKDDYDKCNAANPIIKLDDGNSIFKFDRSGPFYFISGNKSNCDQGQKLHVVVLSPRTHRTPPSPPQVPSAAAPPPHRSSPSQSPASPVPAISPSSTPPSGGSPAPTSVAPAPAGAGPAPSGGSSEPPSPSTTPGAPSSSTSDSPGSSPPESGATAPAGAAPSGGSSEPPSPYTTPGAPSSSTSDSPGSSPPESGAPAPPCSNLLISSLVLSVGVFVFLL